MTDEYDKEAASMIGGSVIDRETVTIKFDGNLEEVSVDTFVGVILGYSQLLRCAAAEIEPNVKLDVNISATRPGCLEAVLSAIMDGLPGLLASVAHVSGQLSTTIDAVKDYLEMRKLLGEKGSPESVDRSDDNVVITMHDNSRAVFNKYVVNIDSSENASKAVATMFSSLEPNEDVRGLLISSDSNSVFEAEHDDFERIRNAPGCTVDGGRVIVKERQALSVTKPALETSGKRKWEFYWNGIKISGNVTDLEFLEKLVRHEYTFGIGDSIIADIELSQVRNQQNVWENKRYRIIKVYDVTEYAENERLAI